ncbi:MAG TPA: RDD family protein [Acidobacteriaceae bacterium]|jgi:uncharacterized RDD family membrane protein YckC|nr:RDD family protein [Acidobacteriaceae bacterium]
MQQNKDEEYLTASTFNLDSPPPEAPVHDDQPPAQEWKQEISARVRAHRNRTGRAPADQPPLPGMEEAVEPNSIAARVAERYARLPSYREMLAAQAAAAAKEAADALAAAATPIPAEPPETAADQSPIEFGSEFELPASPRAPEPYQPDLIRYSVSSDSLPPPRSMPAEARVALPSAFEAADDAFSMADPLDAVIEPTLPLPAHVVTSPRELVAPHKARPRLAEGPLSDDPRMYGAEPVWETRRIAEDPLPVPHSAAEGTEFEDAGRARASASPAPRTDAPPPPEWRSIHLDTEAPIREPKSSSATVDQPAIYVASLEDRALAALIDAALTLSAFLLFAMVFAVCTTSLPHGRAALIGAAAALFSMWLLYQLLFFTLTDATPGMRYAKIALCTFEDDNPERSALRGRIAAQVLSALPLGLGFLWVLFDEDSLGWHDRITRTYQRSYRDD